MLDIELHVRDTNNYVKCLGIWDNAAILEKVRDVPIYFSRHSAILEKVREITISTWVREITIPLVLSMMRWSRTLSLRGQPAQEHSELPAASLYLALDIP